jgi:hypothetical protein
MLMSVWLLQHLIPAWLLWVNFTLLSLPLLGSCRGCSMEGGEPP